MILVYAALVGLAAYRLYRIPARDTFTETFRDWLFADGGRVRQFLDDLLTCPWCIGWWWSGAGSALVAWQVGYEWPWFVLLWCASSTICGLIGKADQ